jgi:hypothetical protein
VSFRKDRTIVLVAVKAATGGGGVALQFADKNLQNDLELIKLADKD